MATALEPALALALALPPAPPNPAPPNAHAFVAATIGGFVPSLPRLLSPWFTTVVPPGSPIGTKGPAQPRVAPPAGVNPEPARMLSEAGSGAWPSKRTNLTCGKGAGCTIMRRFGGVTRPPPTRAGG